MSYAQLMDMINRAQTLDDPAVAGDLIQYLPPDQQQDVPDATAGGTSSSSARPEHPWRGENAVVCGCAAQALMPKLVGASAAARRSIKQA